MGGCGHMGVGGVGVCVGIWVCVVGVGIWVCVVCVGIWVCVCVFGGWDVLPCVYESM